MTKEQGKEIVEYKNLIVQKFTQSDWLELGFILGVSDLIEGHSRLLRSLLFGDDDYEGNVLTVLTQIIEKDSANLEEIKAFIAKKFSTPMASDFISTAHTEVPKKMISFSPQVFSVPNKEQNKKMIAVMFPFSQIKAFETIKETCKVLGLECKKADDIWNNSTFIQDIFDLIFVCEVLIADFTGKNRNVFYEVGIAHTLGKTVIPITQSIDDVPSDLRHHRVLKYLPNTEGYNDM
ncbi:MAG: hypothetical protein JWQ09_5106, partial [Segetibacter sp.]|nr:hypothetical protein [Segetibacter sp.]